MSKIRKSETVKTRELIPRRAKCNIISAEEINMIKEVLQREREMQKNKKKKKRSKKLKSLLNNCASEEINQAKKGLEIKDNLFLSKEESNSTKCVSKTEGDNCCDKNSSSHLSRLGLSHFMDLEERKDLLASQGDDPLSINGPEAFDGVDWVSIKQEVPDDVEVSKVIFTEIPFKAVEETNTSMTDTLHSIPSPSSPLSVKKDEKKADHQTCSDNDKKCPENSDLKTNEINNTNNIENSDINGGPNGNTSWWENDDECSDNDVSNDDDDDDDDDYFSGDKNNDCKLRTESVKRKNRPHVCDICNKTLSSKGSVRLHKKKKHDVVMVFNCELCSFSSDFHRDLINHRNKVHRSEDGRFTCNDCGVARNLYRNFLNHFKARCEDGRVYCNVNSKDKGDRIITFACKACNKNFNEEEELLKHRTMMQCNEGSALGEKLKHQEKNYVCHTCGKRFAFGCLLRDHINLHTGTKPYLCQTCGRSFAQKASLKQHVRTHNLVRPFQCSVCNQGFFGKGDLKKHMRKHTGERPYVCEMCGDGFSQSSHLGVHRRSHTGERPFKCDVCSRGFTKKGDVVRHRRIHTGELPYLCQVCGRAFRQSTQCVNHIKNHHPDALVSISKNPPVSQHLY